MRLVRFEDDSGGFAIELHPLLTVVSGLPVHIRERLVQTVSALPGGADPGGRGALEVHGVFLDLNRESLELLEMNQPLDVILRRNDLPGSEREGALIGAPPPRQSDADAHKIDRELEAAKASVASVNAHLAAVTENLGRLESEADAVAQSFISARAEYEAALERVAREKELAARAAAQAPRQPVAPRPQADPLADQIRERRSVLESRLTELIPAADQRKKEIKRLLAIDTRRVERAAAAATAVTHAEPRLSADAQELLEELRELSLRQVELESSRAGSRSWLVDLTTRRDRAYDAFVGAERALRVPELEPTLVEQLEETHDEIFDLDGRISKIGGAKQRRRLEELREREATLLAQLGFDTWSSYVMGISSGTQDRERHARYEAALAAYQLAEEELARAAGAATQKDPAEDEFAADFTEFHARVTALVGYDPGDDIEAALLGHRVTVATDGSTDLDAIAEELAAALTETGSALPNESIELTQLAAIANGWLDAMSELPARIAQLGHERTLIEGEIASLVAELESLPETLALSAAEPEPVRVAGQQLAEPVGQTAPTPAAVGIAAEHAERLRAGVAERQERERVLRKQIEELRLELGEAEKAKGNAFAALRRAEIASRSRAAVEAEASKPQESAIGRPMSGSAGAEAVEWYVLARLAQQRSVSFVGSVPLVIDDAFSDWSFDELREVFVRLERMSEVIQIIYLTDDSDVGSWARNLGADRARVLDLRARV